MRRLVLAAALLVIPTISSAHVGVRPRESKPGAEERYTVRVPTEGAVTTTSVVLEIPDGVSVLEVLPAEGATFETRKNADRVVAITWKKEIKAKEVGEFVFRARNPESGTEIQWKAHQHFADGSVTAWVEPAGSKRPGPVTKLVSNPSVPTPSSQGADPAAIETWLKGYDAAFNAKDLDKLGSFYHSDVTVYEGGGINNGWADYRDHHLGPELKQFENLQFGHSNTKVHVLPGGHTAYATSEYSLKAKMGEREIDARGLETLVLIKGSDGAWKIRHSHTSSRPARRPQG